MMATDFFDLSQSGAFDRSSLPPELASSEPEVRPIPPANRGTLLLPLCLPTIAFGLIAALAGTWLFHSPSASLLTLAGCLTGLLTTIALFRRQEAAAVAVLNRPELRSANLSQTGVYRTLLGELIHRVEQQEAKAKSLAEQRARLEARAHLQKTQVRRLIHTLNQVEQPVFLLDPANVLTFWNSSATALLKSVTGDDQLPAAEAWKHLTSIHGLVDSVRSRSAAADKRNAEVVLKCGAELITYRADAANLYDEENRLAGVSVILTDIRTQVQETAKQAQFVSSVSHELKTPLASIRAYTELLMDDDVDDPAERLELLKFIDEQVDRLTRLVNNLLNFSRVESGVIKVQREDTDVNRIARKSMEVVATAAKEKRIAIVDQLSDLYLPAHLDLDLFGQAIINLLSNAVKYTPVGGEVRLRTRMQDTEAVIEVIDNGMGIPTDSLSRLFERFYRVPQNSKAAPGTGLGLALVKYIVTNIHDGSIAVSSVVNQGSNFSIRIPLGHRGGRASKQVVNPAAAD
jgi:two-component system phosphate regulon sensor histidine kinase PhoR